jgi:DnaJ-class molecular chaperone
MADLPFKVGNMEFRSQEDALRMADEWESDAQEFDDKAARLRAKVEAVRSAATETEQGRETCPDCFGKGLGGQDERPGLLLPANECGRCGGTGVAEQGRETHG